jgi:molybdenum storage protein
MSKVSTRDERVGGERSSAATDRAEPERGSSIFGSAILPDVVLVALGGQSIFDRGRDGLVPVADEIATARAGRRERLVVGGGGGARVRHAIATALALGLPDASVSRLVGAMEACNAIFLHALMAGHGAVTTARDRFWELPLFLDRGMLPIVTATPPDEPGADPARPASDLGLLAYAEALGMRRIIFVKDEDGLYDRDPKKAPAARRFGAIALDELLPILPDETILDRPLFAAWRHARHVRTIQIVNGLARGQLAAALGGDETVGTVITKGT